MDAIEVNLVDDEGENSTVIESDTSQQLIIDINTSNEDQENEDRVEQSNTSLKTTPNPPDQPDTGQGAKEVVNADITKQVNKRPRVNELDKFKRRLIRAVARLLFEEKKPQEEIWRDLKKETSCDCKLLWTRMSALTIKKLRRLFAANDRLDKITPIAQLSVTDWLLFDLVLVHEDVDVIGQDMSTANKIEPKILKDLYLLVVKHKIEYLSGDNLTLAWYCLTLEYNSRGRKCSPMLLQRRWYQMKEQVRSKFYNFWFTYRGSARKLDEASKYKPTDLQMDIVSQYVSIVTTPFQSWDQLIMEKKVSLPSDFERLQLSRKKRVQPDDGPDLEVIEPHVETIDLRVDSDDENSRESLEIIDHSNNSNKNVIDSENTDSNDGETSETCVKTESICDICNEDEVSALESMHIPLESKVNTVVETNEDNNVTKIKEPIDKNYDNEDIISTEATTDVEVLEINAATNTVEEEVTIEEESQVEFGASEPDGIQDTETTKESNSFEMLMPKITSITSTAHLQSIPIDDDDDDVHDQINSILEEVADKIVHNKSDNLMSKPISKEQEIKKELTVKVEKKTENIVPNENLLNDLHMIDGIELEDDGIEYFDEDEEIKEIKMEFKVEENYDECDGNDGTPKIDLKLLLNPIVYTKKLDDMDVFRFIDYTTVKDKRIIENSIFESKPVDKDSVNMKNISQEFQNLNKSEPTTNADSVCDSDDDYERIKTTSWLFRKPRAPSYNPIQLCKNPDFNTRLKWLTVGFFSSQRNRQLLKECKPITIDVSKAFETKLVNNTLYLEKSYFSEAKISPIKTVEKTVVPSELPGQTLLCSEVSVNSTSVSGTNRLLNDELKPKEHEIERNKVINLPDFDQIRRTNKKLLVAEVTPLQVSNVINKPPVTIVQDNAGIVQNSSSDNNTQKDVTVNCPMNTDITTSSVSLTTEKNSSIDLGKLINDNCNDINTKKLSYYLKKKLLDNNTKYPNKIQLPKTNHKVRPVNVTWKPRFLPTIESDIPNDRLLATDTVERIISVCKGVTLPLLKKNQKTFLKRKSYLEAKQGTVNDDSIPVQDNIITDNVTDIKTDTKIDNTKSDSKLDDEINSKKVKKTANKTNNVLKNATNTDNEIQRRRRSTLHYCCWAREKMDILNNKLKRVRTRHLCPQYKCICCCRLEYCKILQENRLRQSSRAMSSVNLVSYDENEKSAKDLNSVNNKIKVSIGVNTDFNKDFEQCYASSISVNNISSEDSIINEPVTSIITSVENNANSLSTQTVPFGEIEHLSALKRVVASLDVMPNIETVGPIISNVRSEVSNVIPTPPLQSIKVNLIKSKQMKPKCKTNIHHASVYSSILPKQQIVTNIQETKLPDCDFPESATNKSKNSNKVVVLNTKLRNNLVKNPICLGKNKILLCSVKPLSKTNMIDVSHLIGKNNLTENNMVPQYIDPNLNPSQNSLPLMPKGVHLVLLPNQELALAIDPGVELNAEQIANIPTILSAVQQQLGVLGDDNTTQSTVANDDVIQLSDDENSVENKKDKQYETCSLQKNLEKDVSLNEINKSEPSYKVNEPTGEGNNASERESENISDDVPILGLINHNKENSMLKNLEDSIESDSFSTNEKNMNNQISEIGATNNVNDVVDNSIDSSRNIFEKPKKTILSDLMEMSGISLEDTNITNIEIPAKEQPLLSEVPSLQPTNANFGNVSDDNNESPCNSILYNPFVQSALLKCPDLNIVSSFEELKYVYENDGQFYKMDIETGIIVPINVSIKKQRHIKQKLICSKSVIDLTEDDDNIDDNGKSNTKFTFGEHNTESAMEIDVSPESVKPIKLFKAMHPSLLRQKLTQKMNEIKACKVIKRKKNIGNINLISDVERIKNIENKETNKQKETSYSDSESDDEPLALKAKRIKTPNETTCKIENVKMSEDKTQENVLSDVAVKNLNEIPLSESNLPENENEASNTEQIQPLFLQYNTDGSSEEDCILGV